MPSNPWIWRTEFFGAFPALDLALLKAGFPWRTSMSKTCTELRLRCVLDRFYAEWSKRLDCLPSVCGGFSRGALYALNWAALNPRSVACLYLDAPVCDFKSWPAGRGRAQGSADDWQRLKQHMALPKNRRSRHPSNPVDFLVPIAAAGIPIIAVYGDADIDLPPEENICCCRNGSKHSASHYGHCEARCRHHPHSLANPAPLSSFILSRVSRLFTVALTGDTGPVQIPVPCSRETEQVDASTRTEGSFVSFLRRRA